MKQLSRRPSGMFALFNLFRLSVLPAAPLAALLIAYSGSYTWAVTAFEAPPGGWMENSFSLLATGEYFSSKANYDATRGSYSRLPGDSSFQTFETKYRGRYNHTARTSYFGGLGISYSHAIDQVNDKTNSQFTDLFIGADYLLNKKYVHIVPEIQAGLPLSPTDPNQTTPLTSDGVMYVRAGLFAHKPFKNFRLGGYSGFHVPSDGLASKFLYELTVDMRAFKVATLGFGIDGYETVMSDKKTRADRTRTAALADAASNRFYGFEPSLLEVRGWLGFRPDKSLWVRIGLAKTVNGTNAAEGQSILASIAYNSPRLDKSSPREPEYRKLFRPDVETAKKTFKPAEEPNEQDVFDSEEFNSLPGTGKGDLDRTERLLENRNEPEK